MEQIEEAALAMATVYRTINTQQASVDMLDGRCPGVTRDQLALLWHGCHASQVSHPLSADLGRLLLEVALSYQEWIKAVPDDVAAALPAMPGIDGDWAAEILDSARRALTV